MSEYLLFFALYFTGQACSASIDHRGPKLSRRAAFDLFEGTVEGRNAGEPGFKSDIRNAKVRIQEEGLSKLHPFNGQKVHKGHVGITFEKMSKVGSADTDLNGNII